MRAIVFSSYLAHDPLKESALELTVEARGDLFGELFTGNSEPDKCMIDRWVTQKPASKRAEGLSAPERDARHCRPVTGSPRKWASTCAATIFRRTAERLGTGSSRPRGELVQFG